MSDLLSLRLFGGFEARVGSGPLVLLPKKVQALLAYLVLAPRPVFPREEMAALLWGDTADVQARQSLRKALSGLRRLFNRDGAVPIAVTGRTVAINRAAVDVDVWRFDDLVRRGTPTALARAAALYGGELLARLTVDDGPFADWVIRERARRLEDALATLVRLLAHQTSTGARAAAVETATRLLALDPLHEPTHRALMRLHASRGQRAAALRQYHACVELLARELSVAPEAETKRLYEGILRDTAFREEPLDSPRPSRPPRRAPRPADTATVGGGGATTPLVGRDAETARLHAALASAAGGEARVVALVGEAGVGKTRLVTHWCAEASGRGARVILGRAYASEQILPFGPWTDALRAGGVVNDRVLHGERTDWKHALARLLPELGGAPPGDDPVRVFEAVAALLTALASEQPLLVVLEDLHWADDRSLSLLAFLSRRLHDQPILFVVSARDEQVADTPGLRAVFRDLEGTGRTVVLPVGPLTARDTATLVAAAGLDDDDVARRIWAATAGNPLMVVEMVGMLREAPPADTGPLPLPERVREMIITRLEAVSDEGRRLAEAAAVIGRDAAFAVLQRVSGLDEADATAAAEELVRRRILRLSGEAFEFTHDRIREVVYVDMLPPRRRLLHSRVAESLQAREAARHETVEAARAAGARAFTLGDCRDAAATFRAALDTLARRPEDRDTLAQAIDLRLDLHHALIPLSEVASLRGVTTEAVALAERLGDRRRLGQALAFLGTPLWWDGAYGQALQACRRAGAIADELDDAPLRVSARLGEAQAHHALGEYERAAALLRECLGSPGGDLVSQRFGATDFGDVVVSSRLAWSLAELGHFADAKTAAVRAVNAATPLGHPYLLSLAYQAAALTDLRRGDVDEAIRWLESLRSTGTADGDFESRFPVAGWLLAWAYALAGRPAAVPAAGQSPPEEHVFLAPLWLTCFGEARLLLGAPVDAHALATAAVARATVRGERGHRAWALRLLGDVAAHKGDLADAEARYREACDLARVLGMRPLHARCLRGLGEVHGRMDRVDDARDALTAADRMDAELGMRE